ncbi:hypothetical protein EJD96_12070 [Herbaspirillum seropedicae]|nr:hypothetical protein EJD96_12070 [Herbaspirillum seropedicae]
MSHPGGGRLASTAHGRQLGGDSSAFPPGPPLPFPQRFPSVLHRSLRRKLDKEAIKNVRGMGWLV